MKAIFFVMVSLVFAGIVSTASAQGAGVVVVTQTDAVVKVLKADHLALSEPYFSIVQRGTFREDVQRLLAPPKEVRNFPSRGEETWSWRYLDITYMQFHVIFDRAQDRVNSMQRMQEVPPVRRR